MRALSPAVRTWLATGSGRKGLRARWCKAWPNKRMADPVVLPSRSNGFRLSELVLLIVVLLALGLVLMPRFYDDRRADNERQARLRAERTCQPWAPSGEQALRKHETEWRRADFSAAGAIHNGRSGERGKGAGRRRTGARRILQLRA